VSGQLHAPAALPPGKEPPVPIGSEVGWTPEPVWMIWSTENSWPYRDSNSDPSVVQPVASRYTDYATPAPSTYTTSISKNSLGTQKLPHFCLSSIFTRTIDPKRSCRLKTVSDLLTLNVIIWYNGRSQTSLYSQITSNLHILEKSWDWNNTKFAQLKY
jgi:hypothetical protein